MSIKDIIEAATKGEWIASLYPDKSRNDCGYRAIANLGDYMVAVHRSKMNWADEANAEFIAAFNPEHMLLVEDVLDCVGDKCNDECEWQYSDKCPIVELKNYRKERGLL